MKKRLLRPLSLLLAMVMVFGMLPFGALAETGLPEPPQTTESLPLTPIAPSPAPPAPEASQAPERDVPAVPEDLKAEFTAPNGKQFEVRNGETLAVTEAEAGGFFHIPGLKTQDMNGDGAIDSFDEMKWGLEWKLVNAGTPGDIDGPNPTARLAIGLYSGKLSVKIGKPEEPDEGRLTKTVTVKWQGNPIMTFTLQSAPVKTDETQTKVLIDGAVVTDAHTVQGGGTHTMTAQIKGPEDSDFHDIPVSVSGYDSKVLAFSGGTFRFIKPDVVNLIVTAAGIEHKLALTSAYVPVESITVSPIPTTYIHGLMYSMGDQGGFMGITDQQLVEACVVLPENASYARNITWKSADDSIAKWWETHGDGFIAYKAGEVEITATCTDLTTPGNTKSGTAEVEFSYHLPLTAVKLAEGTTEITVKEGDSLILPLDFAWSENAPIPGWSPDNYVHYDHPSEPTLKWTYDAGGVVEIRQPRSTYDFNLSTINNLTALKMGDVVVTGTPLDQTKNARPITFTVHVTEGNSVAVPVETLLADGYRAAEYHYQNGGTEITKYAYNSEWDLMTQFRAGYAIPAAHGGPNATAVADYTASITAAIQSKAINATMNPTDLERVALTLNAIGEDASNFAEFNFIEALYNHPTLDEGSNDLCFALLALDSRNYQVPSGAKWSRDSIVAALLPSQQENGGFSLGGDGDSVDATAMVLQGLANYQDKPEVKASIEKAFTYLRERMAPDCTFGTSESAAQVILMLTTLGLDPLDPANGFTSGKTRTLLTGLNLYRTKQGYEHTVGDGVDKMATEQALRALISVTRQRNDENRVYDMTDVPTAGNLAPVITVTGAPADGIVAKSQLTLTIAADLDASPEVTLNGTAISGTGGSYALTLKIGVNELRVKAVSAAGVVAHKLVTLTFKPYDYTTDLAKDMGTLTAWANTVIPNSKLFDAEHAALQTTVHRNGAPSLRAYRDLEIKAKDMKFENVTTWADTILAVVAMGADPANVGGVNLLEKAPAGGLTLPFGESAAALLTVNAKAGYADQVPSALIPKKLAQMLLTAQRADGGFATEGETSRLGETALAATALAGLPAYDPQTKDALDWLAANWKAAILPAEGSTVTAQSANDAALMLTALSENGIDFTLDARWSEESNLYTVIHAALTTPDVYTAMTEAQKQTVYIALSAYRRVAAKQTGYYDMTDLVTRAGLTVTNGEMRATAADYLLANADFTKYSPEATEAAFLLLRDDVALRQADAYAQLLNAAMAEGFDTAREYFYAALLLKELGLPAAAALTGVSARDWTFTIRYDDGDESVMQKGTVNCAYALMTLDLEPTFTPPADSKWTREALIAALKGNYILPAYVADADHIGYGCFAEYNLEKDLISLAYAGARSSATALAALTPHRGDDKLLTDRLKQTTGYLYTGGGVDAAYYASARMKDDGTWSNYFGKSAAGNLPITADVITGLLTAGLDPTTAEAYQKENGNPLDGVKSFYTGEGFGALPYTADADLASTLSGYQAVLALDLYAAGTHLYTPRTEPADKTALTAKLDVAKAIQKGSYTDAGWNALQSAILVAESVLANESAGRNQVNVQVELLTAAVRGLTTGASKPETTDITVSFRLIGDGEHDDGVTDHGKYVTWIATQRHSVTLEKGKSLTVYDVFTQALDAAGIAYTGAEDNYVDSIQAPAVLGGYWLSEFDNGPNSGWMYTVNGTHPNVGLQYCKLKDGDKIIWHYVDDYALETTDRENPVTPTHPNRWLEATDVNPGKSEAGGGQIGPVLAPEATVKDGKATATVTGKGISAAIDAVLKDKSGVITIAATGAEKAGSLTVTLPKAAAQSVVDKTGAKLVVESAAGNVSIPNDVLSSITAQAKGGDIAVTVARKTAADVQGKADALSLKDAVIVEITIKSADSAITTFDGKRLTLTLPAGSAHAEGHSYKVLAISDGDDTDAMTGKCVKQDGKPVVEIATTHLSIFVATAQESTLFTDITGHWAYDAIAFAYEKGLMNGVSDTLFQPDGAVSRAMLVTALYRMVGEPAVTGKGPFADVANGAWYENAVIWASENNIVSGYENGSFAPMDDITREQMVTMLYRYAAHRNYDMAKTNDLAAFTDAAGIAPWALDAMRWGRGTGLITGRTASAIAPTAGATRGEMATLLQRFSQQIVK